jgi:predicted small lipoprotein YifL
MKNKKARVLIALAASAAILSLSGCGYQGGYRYPCQDPANWGAKECVPPECKALGLCTNDILGFDPLDPNANTTETTTQGETSNG